MFDQIICSLIQTNWNPLFRVRGCNYCSICLTVKVQWFRLFFELETCPHKPWLFTRSYPFIFLGHWLLIHMQERRSSKRSLIPNTVGINYNGIQIFLYHLFAYDLVWIPVSRYPITAFELVYTLSEKLVLIFSHPLLPKSAWLNISLLYFCKSRFN